MLLDCHLPVDDQCHIPANLGVILDDQLRFVEDPAR